MVRLSTLEATLRNTAGKVRFDNTGDDIDGGSLGREDEVDAGSAGKLGESGNSGLDVGGRNHHEVGKFVNHSTM